MCIRVLGFGVVGVKVWDAETKGFKIENNSLKYHIQTGNIQLLRDKSGQTVLSYVKVYVLDIRHKALIEKFYICLMFIFNFRK